MQWHFSYLEHPALKFLQNPVVFWYVVCLGFFVIAIIILTTVKWITGKVLAAHRAETCLRQEQGFVYLTSETGKGGGNFSLWCPFSAEPCTSLYLNNIHPLCTFVPGSPAPSNSSFLVYLRVRNLSWSAWGASGGAAEPRCAPGRERSSSGWREHPGHSPPALGSAAKDGGSPQPWPLTFQGIPFQLRQRGWFPDRAGIPASVGGGNHVGEGRKSSTVLPKYLKSWGAEHFFFFYKLLLDNWAGGQLQSHPSSVLGRGTGKPLLVPLFLCMDMSIQTREV